ncbi:MAG TPA: hypothetical protein VGP72_11950 [Planctomycetota bacterium]|jgi:hypothetical protein
MNKTGMHGLAEERADSLLAKLRPLVVEMMERYDASHRDVTFDQIEADAAGRGDLLARELMKQVLASQARATTSEERELCAEVAGQTLGCGAVEHVRTTHVSHKRRKLKTMRGEIEYERDYLYFPDLQHGVFPPRPAAGDSGQRDDTARSTDAARTGR